MWEILKDTKQIKKELIFKQSFPNGIHGTHSKHGALVITDKVYTKEDYPIGKGILENKKREPLAS